MADVFRSVTVAFRISKLLGFTAFRIERGEGGGGRFAFSAAGALYPCCLALVYASVSAFDVYTRGRRDTSEIYRIVELVNVHSFAANTLSIMFFGVCYQRRTVDLINAIDAFDAALTKRRPLAATHRAVSRHALAFATVAHLFSATLLVADAVCFFPERLDGGGDPLRFKFLFTYCTPLFASGALVVETNVLLVVLASRFRLLNARLRGLRRRTAAAAEGARTGAGAGTGAFFVEGRVGAETFPEAAISDLEEIRRHFDSLHAITRKTNSVYSVRIAGQLYQIFVSLITNVLFFVKQREDANERKRSASYVFIMVVVMVVNVGQLVSMCAYGARLENEAKKTPLILHELKNSSKLNDYITFFSNQLLHLKVNIIACDMIKLDVSLLFSVVASATSYLIICVQLEIPNN